MKITYLIPLKLYPMHLDTYVLLKQGSNGHLRQQMFSGQNGRNTLHINVG